MYTSRFLFLCLFLTFVGYSQTYKIDEKYIYSWNDVSSDWQHDVTQQYTYENGGTKETKLVMLSMPGMVNLSQSLKSYNDDNDIILENRQFWNPVNSEWNDNAQVVYTYYDTTKYLKDETLQIYNVVTMVYDNFSRETYEYTGANRTKQTSQTWNGTVWENDEKVDITYENGLPKEAEYSSWNSTTSMWEAYERDTATYNANDLPTEILEETYNMGAWEISGRTVYTYSGLLQIVVLFQTWNGTNWVNDDRELTGYDTNDNPDELIYQEWDDINSIWENYYKEDRFFSPAAPLSTESFQDNKFIVYPNPVNDKLFMKFNSSLSNKAIAEVYAMDGRLVKSENIGSGVESRNIDLENLMNGMYLLKIIDNNNFNQTIRFIKQ